jgi:hypothetical protein
MSVLKKINIDNLKLKNIQSSFSSSRVKYGGYAALMTLAVIAGLLLLNLMMGRFQLQLDMTESRIFSLSEQSRHVLGNVTSPVKIFGLWRPGERLPVGNGRDYIDDATSVINLYTARNNNISFELIDPDRNPGFVIRYDRERRGIARGSVIIEGTNGFRVISVSEMYDVMQNQQTGGINVTGVAIERRITSALLFLATGDTPVVYEVAGNDTIPLAALGMQESLEQDSNILIRSFNLLMSPIPADASALIINHPQSDITEIEAEKLLEYLEAGGRLLLLADYGIRALENFNRVFASYGFNLNYGILHEVNPEYAIFDPRSTWPDAAPHEITRPLLDKTRHPMIMFEALSISRLDAARQTLAFSPLLLSSGEAFLRTDLNLATNDAAQRMPGDIPGQHTLAAAIIDPDPARYRQGEGEAQTRIVVIGSGTFLPFAAAGFTANNDFFVNSLAWLQDRPETISAGSRSLFLLPLRLNAMQFFIFAGLFIFVIPVAFFVTGFVVWLRRRHL